LASNIGTPLVILPRYLLLVGPHVATGTRSSRYLPLASNTGTPLIIVPHYLLLVGRHAATGTRSSRYLPLASNTGTANSTSDYTLWTLHRSYFKGISANIEL
jgi:hypothetical protein